MQVRKTYRKLSPEMLYDEIRDLLEKHGMKMANNRLQTYGVPSGATQSRVVASIVTSKGEPCGALHIVGSAGGDARLTVEIDEGAIAAEAVESITSDIDFMLGQFEVRW